MPSVSATALPPPHESHRPVWYPGALGTPDFARGALEAGGGLNLIFSRASGTSRSCHSLRNRAPGRWRHQGRSGAHATCWCSGALGTPDITRVALGASGGLNSILPRCLVPAEVVTVSAIEHQADGATGGARGRLVLRCSWLACERVRRAQRGARPSSVHPRASVTSRNRHSLRNRAPGRWRQRRRSGAPGARLLVGRGVRLQASY